MNFNDYCEWIFQQWKKKPNMWANFQRDFQLDYVPEPYYTMREGENTLYVLRYYPGPGLPIQLRENIIQYDNYNTVANNLAQYYENNLNNSLWNRILDFATALGFNGVKCVETFYLHKGRIRNGNQFLASYYENSLVQEYTNILKDYLKDKMVLAIATSNARTIESLRNASYSWLQFRSNIIGLDLQNADFIGNPTSGWFIGNNGKMASIISGNFNLPRYNALQLEQISNSFNH